MASSGSLIRALDYNTVQANVNQILGTGTGQYGLGQSVSSTQVSANTDIVASTNWAQVKTDILKVANSQGTASSTSITDLPDIVPGKLIEASDVVLFQNAITHVDANRFQLAQFSDELLVTSTRTTSWNRTIRHFFTLEFTTADAARFYFNSGSTIRILPDFAKSSSTAINNSWETLINTIGAVSFNHNSTAGTGSAPGSGTSIGFYNLTTTFQQVYIKQLSTNVYTGNNFRVRARCDVANNTLGTARLIFFEVYYADDKTGGIDENVTGTVTNTVRSHRASGVNVNVSGPTAATTVELSAAQV
jgi:hypothetical protein